MKAIWPLTWFAISIIPMVLIRSIFIALGIIIVPIAIPFAKEKKSRTSGRTILTYDGIFWVWGNDSDGLLGDSRGRWHSAWQDIWYSRLRWLRFTGLVGPLTSCFVAKYIWAAFRNPANNMRFTKLFMCEYRRCQKPEFIGQEIVSDRVGRAGWHFIWTYRKRSLLPFCGLYIVKMLDDTEQKCLRLRLGFKLAVGGDNSVGFCAVVSPYKSVHQKKY